MPNQEFLCWRIDYSNMEPKQEKCGYPPVQNHCHAQRPLKPKHIPDETNLIFVSFLGV